MDFSIALIQVAVMLAYAVPGYLLVKTKAVTGDNIPAFTKLLMFVCQPCMIVFAFNGVSFSYSILKDIFLFFIITLLLQLITMLIMCVVLKKKFNDIRYRVGIVATYSGNVAFMGIPLLERLIPNNPEVILFSTVFAVTLNLLGWTLSSAIITKNFKYVSLKKIFINPVIIALIPAFFLLISGVNLPSQFENSITFLGRMTTPLSMIIMGMRLATIKLKSLFTYPLNFIIVTLKQIVYPAFCFALLYFIPLRTDMKSAIIIMCCCPVASVVLNFTELLNEGQESAVRLVLLGTIASVVTIPFMILLLF